MTAVTATSVSVAGDESLSVTPTGNSSPATFSSLSCQATASKGLSREFLVNLGLTTATGAGTGSTADKVTLYSGVVGQNGTHDIWSLNTLVEMSASSGSYNAQGYELDFNNLNADRGNSDGNSGLAAPVAVGLSLSGVGSFRSTAAISIVGGTTTTWNRGIVLPNPGNGGCVAQASFQDNCSSTISLDIRGSHSYSLDTMNSSGIPVRLPNNSPIVARNAANTGNVTLIYADTANNVEVGATSGFIVANTHTIPSTDNAYYLGFPSNRWIAVYAVNGTIQTSDPALKTDINLLPPVDSLIKNINPVTFRWKEESAELIDVTETETVHETEWQDVEEDGVIIQNGKAVKTRITRKAEIHLYDELPLEDEHGNPVTIAVPEQLDASGAVIRPAFIQPVTYRVPRMVTRQTTVRRPVSPGVGKRVHWGFLAPDVKAAFDAIGMDFGGHHVGDDGIQGLRPDQLIPVLWKAVQDLLARVEALEAQKP